MTPVFTPLVLYPLTLSAASGLIRAHGRTFVIADDERALVEYSDLDAKEKKISRLPGPLLPREHRERKKKKPDFESLLLVNDTLIAWPSFSTPHRTRAGIFPRWGESPELVRETELSGLRLKLLAYVSEMNIEGACLLSEALYLFQRGNGPSRENGYFRIPIQNAEVLLSKEADSTLSGAEIQYIPCALGEIEGVRLGFTDAAAWNDHTLIALAAAERSDSTYADGEILGSELIRIDLFSGEAKSIASLSGKKKYEGMALEASGEDIRVFLVDDGDSPEVTSHLACFSLPRSLFG